MKQSVRSGMFLLFISLTLVSCTRSDPEFSAFPPLNFTIQPELLSAIVVIDNNLSLGFPVECKPVEEKQFTDFKAKVESDAGAYFPLKLKSVVTSEENMTVIINRIDSSEPIFELLDDNYAQYISANFSTDSIVKGNYKIGEINVVQYMITTEDLVTIKLICQVQKTFYQVDYFIPKGRYEKELESIESSIGSIKIH